MPDNLQVGPFWYGDPMPTVGESGDLEILVKVHWVGNRWGLPDLYQRPVGPYSIWSASRTSSDGSVPCGTALGALTHWMRKNDALDLHAHKVLQDRVPVKVCRALAQGVRHRYLKWLLDQWYCHA
jgi:hypothetical protein